ncbi:DUF4352 domain-containing protein [Listeria monocytogenes]|nr:DUF4352 domain-containing protein [Listeria monocytogenes]
MISRKKLNWSKASKKQKILFLGGVIVALIIVITAVSSLFTEKEPENNDLSKIYNVGDQVFYNGMQLKVNKVTYSDGTRYNTPKNGNEYIIVNVTLTNKSELIESYNPYDFTLSGDGDKEHLNSIYLDDNIDLLHLGNLLKDESSTGDLVSQVKKDSKSLKLMFKSDLFNGKSITIKLK